MDSKPSNVEDKSRPLDGPPAIQSKTAEGWAQAFATAVAGQLKPFPPTSQSLTSPALPVSFLPPRYLSKSPEAA